MFNISDVTVAPLSKSLFVQPKEMHYTLNGVKKKWDFIQAHSSVTMIIFNVTRNVLVLVRQFRPPVYAASIPFEEQQGLIDCKKYPAELGLTLEFCAGLVDKDKSLEVIAQEEILEETGYEVPLSKLEKVRKFRTTVGVSGGVSTLFYVEVEDHMKKAKGQKNYIVCQVYRGTPSFVACSYFTRGGLESEGEFIEIVELSLADAKDLCDGKSENVPFAPFLFGLLWFFHFKVPTLNLN